MSHALPLPPRPKLRHYQKRAKDLGEIVELIALENAGHYELIAPWTRPGKLVVAKILDVLK